MKFNQKRIIAKQANYANTTGHVLKGLGLLYLVLMLSGCATLKQKFQPKTQANVSVFADTTLSMLSQADLGFDQDEGVYVREFFDPAGEEEKKLIKSEKQTRGFFREIIKYSLKLVVITETHENPADRVKAYADYISDFDDTLLKKFDLEKDYYATVIEEVRAQVKFMDALKKAQPIIHRASLYMNAVLDERYVAIENVARKLDWKIDERYAEVIQYQMTLEKEKYAVLRAMAEVYLTYRGDPDAFGRLVKSGAVRKKGLVPKGRPSDEDLNNIAGHLEKRLEGLHLIGTEIKPDWDNYRTTHIELDKLHNQEIDRVNKARLVTLVWLRAHQKMAAGVQSPAEWFDINDLPAKLFQLGTKAVF